MLTDEMRIAEILWDFKNNAKRTDSAFRWVGRIQAIADAAYDNGKAECKTEEEIRWEVGEELCCLIGNLMLENMEAGKLLGKQLGDYMKQYLKSSPFKS